MWDSYGLPSAIRRFAPTVSSHPCPVGFAASVRSDGKDSSSLRGHDLEAFAPADPFNLDRSFNWVAVRKVILAYDGSRPAEKALDLALSVTRSFKARLHIVGIAALPHTSSAADLQTIIERVRKRFAKKFYEIRLNAMNEGLQVETMLTLGDPIELTLGNAERFHAGLIVMGYPGFSAPPSLEPTALLEKLSARTARPVLVVSAAKRMKKLACTMNEVTE
jgi:nucleotide-binding universal stress UspA family protein